MVKFLSNLKYKFVAVIAIIMALCVGFVAFGCGNETKYEYVLRVSREEFNLKKVLWMSSAHYCNTISEINRYTPKGSVHRADSAFSMRGGWYVVGIDSVGYETFILVPPQEDSGIKPKEYQWPFAYSFTEIANFAAEYGYKYAAGIDGREKEYFDDLWIGAFESFDIEEIIKPILGSFGDGEELYDKLDVKFMFRFTSHLDDKTFADYWITQEGGVLKMYEVKNDYKPENITVITYSRDKA